MSVIVCLFLHLEKQGQLRLQVQRTTQLSTLSLADKVCRPIFAPMLQDEPTRRKTLTCLFVRLPKICVTKCVF